MGRAEIGDGNADEVFGGVEGQGVVDFDEGIEGRDGIFEGDFAQPDPVTACEALLEIAPVIGDGHFEIAGVDRLREGVAVPVGLRESGDERGVVGDGGAEVGGSVGFGGEAEREVAGAVGVGIGVAPGADFGEGSVGSEVDEEDGIGDAVEVVVARAMRGGRDPGGIRSTSEPGMGLGCGEALAWSGNEVFDVVEIVGGGAADGGNGVEIGGMKGHACEEESLKNFTEHGETVGG